MRIALAPNEIAGFYSTLRRGFDEIGMVAEPIWLADHPFAYSRSDGPLVLRIARRYWMRYLTSQSLGMRFLWVLLSLPWRVAVLVWAIFRFDAFVFACGESLFKLLELPLLKVLGKRMMFVFHGSDIRPPYLNCAILRQTRDPVELARRTRSMKRRVRWIERYADVIVTHPVWSHLLERPFVPFSRLGQTSPAPELSQPARGPSTERVRILHAPSDPVCKGSALVRAAVERVRAAGIPIEYVEIVGRPNREVIDEIQRADIVVDQVLSDIRVAGLANEATWLGVCVVVAGYAREALDSYADCELIPPTVYCEPEELVDTIARLASDHSARHEIAAEAQRFSLENWNPRTMAERMSRLLSGDVTADWTCDPKRVDYVWGYGLSKEEVSGVVGEVIRRCGVGGLCVDDKPHLLERFREIAACEPGGQS